MSDEIAAALTNALQDRYRLERELGRGGMATVYLARDLKHDRDVALKVLKPDLAALLGRERFLAEIQLTARLDHPHILTLIDSGESDGFLWYVVPLIRGESLRQRLDREKQLAVGEAVAITRQVAGALEHAHRHGVIHRDLKPENILLHEGEAMLVDFGIALAVREAGGNRLTETGLSLGTPQYMSPEQATGDRHLDARADVYSLGAVLYEMLAGEPPHTGPTVQAVIAKLMTERPTRLRVVRDTVPAGLDEAVATALAKASADRFPSAAAFVEALSAATYAKAAGEPVAARSAGLRPGWRTALLVPAAAALLYFGWRLTRTEPPLTIGAVTPVTFEQGLEIDPDLSPDGRYIAYVAGSPFRIFLRQPGSRPVQLVMPDTGPQQRRPRWSPDGSRILFDWQQRLFVIPALGGVPRLVAAGCCPAWAPDGRRVAFLLGDTIYAAEIGGGAPTKLASVKQSAELRWSPDGRWIALTSGNNGWDGVAIGNIAQTRLFLIDVREGRAIPLTDRSAMNVSPVWAPDSRRVLFVSNQGGGRDIYSMRLNAGGRPAGPPVRLSTGLDAHTIHLSAGGRRITYSSYHARVNIWTLPIPASGPVGLADATPLTSGNQSIESVALSADSRWLYFNADRSGNSDIYRLALPSGEPEQLTMDLADDFGPALSPDAAWLAFYSLRGGTRDVWVMPSGPGDVLRLTDDPGEEFWPHWAPDGQRVCYTQFYSDSGDGIRLIRRSGAGWSKPVRLEIRAAAGGTSRCYGWMPDGRRIIALTGEEISLVPVDGGPAQVVYRGDPSRGLPTPGTPIVSPDGRFVYFRGAGGLWGVPAGGGAPRELVRFDDSTRLSTREEWATDGRRFYFTLGDPQSDVFVAELSGLK